MGPIREACLGPHGRPCRDSIEEKGLTVDEYWASALPEYRLTLGKIKLYQTVMDERGLSDADYDTLIMARANYDAEVHRNADIVWRDENLKRLYEQAVASE